MTIPNTSAALSALIRRGGKATRGAVVLAFVFFYGVPAPAGSAISEHEIKAELLERFTRFVEWPEESGAATDAPFVIAFIGSTPLGGYVQKLAAGTRIKGRPVEVHQVATADEAAAGQVLFVAASERAQLGKILQRTAALPILTVADSAGFGERGVLINFYTAENRVHFEINLAAVGKSGLEISSRLLRLGRIIQGSEDTSGSDR